MGTTRRTTIRRYNVGGFSEKEVELSIVHDDTFLELTIDSGAGENAMSEHMAPRTPVQVSREQQAGVMYTAANGEIISCEQSTEGVLSSFLSDLSTLSSIVSPSLDHACIHKCKEPT